MKNIFILLLVLVGWTACKNEDKPAETAKDDTATTKPVSNDFTINGTVIDADSGWVFFRYDDTVNVDKSVFSGPKDSAKIIGSKFTYTGKVEQPVKVFTWAKAYRTQGSGLQKMFIDRGTTNVNMSAVSFEGFKASGTPAQDLFASYESSMLSLIKESNAIFGARMKMKRTASPKVLDSLDAASKEVDQRMQAQLEAFVQKNPSSIVSAFVTYEFLKSHSDVDPAMIYSLFTGEAKESAYAAKVADKLAAFDRTDIGRQMPVFTIADKNGQPKNINNLLSTYTLIDFWASWCGPCRAENPYMLKAYNRFKDKGFSIVGVSLDDSKKNWFKAMEEDNIPWMQLSDLKGSSSPLLPLFGITAIPRNFLVDKTGKIIAKDLRGEALEKKLNELL